MHSPHVPPPTQEVVYFRGSPSGLEPIFKSLKAVTIVAALIFIPMFIVSFDLFETLRSTLFHYSSYLAIAIVVLLVGLAMYLSWVWWGWQTIQYTLTNRKITFERGRFSKTIKSIELWRVREMIFERSAIESLFGVGRIHLVSNDLTGPFTQVGPITRARKIYESLDAAREAAIKERGVMAVES